MRRGEIRPLALGIFRNGDHILVLEGFDPVKQQYFYRPLGGGIQFGERGADALAREMREELGAEIADVRFLGLIESLFTFSGERGHELVLLFEARLPDRRLVEADRLTGHEDDGDFAAMWKPLSAFGPGGDVLVPEGLLEMLCGQPAAPSE